jgi:hypothetical protein
MSFVKCVIQYANVTNGLQNIAGPYIQVGTKTRDSLKTNYGLCYSFMGVFACGMTYIMIYHAHTAIIE